jgi:hypothetical protein
MSSGIKLLGVRHHHDETVCNLEGLPERGDFLAVLGDGVRHAGTGVTNNMNRVPDPIGVRLVRAYRPEGHTTRRWSSP